MYHHQIISCRRIKGQGYKSRLNLIDEREFQSLYFDRLLSHHDTCKMFDSRFLILSATFFLRTELRTSDLHDMHNFPSMRISFKLILRLHNITSNLNNIEDHIGNIVHIVSRKQLK